MAVAQPDFIAKMLKDPQYGDDLRTKASAAVLGGQNSPAWKAYFEAPDFASLATDPAKLQALGATGGAAACTCNSTTVTTLTSPICTGTTTTGSG